MLKLKGIVISRPFRNMLGFLTEIGMCSADFIFLQNFWERGHSMMNSLTGSCPHISWFLVERVGAFPSS